MAIVSVSVVTYNSEDQIGMLLDSIQKYVKNVDLRIFVVDNCSHDRTLEIVRTKCSQATVIENKKNVGFGAGHNKVLDLIDSEFHVCINPDITLNSDVISEMADYMKNNLDIGVISPKVLYPDGSVQILPKRDPRLRYLFARRSKIKALKKCKDIYEMTDAGVDNTYDIEFASGCFIFVRTALLKKVGGFDECYFMYLEDADLSRMIREYARIQYNPAFTVYHHWRHAGAKQLNLLLIHVISMLKYLIKWGKISRKKKLG